MKKSLVLMLAVILVTSLFAGCGQGGGKTTTDAILYYACGSEPYLHWIPVWKIPTAYASSKMYMKR